MSFILLGKQPDNRVMMLSEDVYETRKDATEALSSLTSGSAFDWDAEVYVVDIDKATPVLLVRPAAAEDATALEDIADLPADEEAFTYAGSDAGSAEEDTESLVVEEEGTSVVSEEEVPASSDTDLQAALSELGLGEEPDVEAAAEASEVEAPAEEAPADEHEAEEAPAEEAPVEEHEAEEAPEEGAALRDAIARTTEQMAASGIVPPESVGPQGEEGASESADDEKAWPWASGGEEGAEQGGEFSLSALEEPGSDTGSLVKAAGDDETMDAARPVILGDYDDVPAAEPMSIAEADAVAAEAGPSDELAQALADAILETGVAVEAEDDAPSDSAPAAEGSDAAGDELSCDDCMYFENCPHKEGRTPSSCGSFQFK